MYEPFSVSIGLFLGWFVFMVFGVYLLEKGVDAFANKLLELSSKRRR
jgi:hypothetical protein